ncbi:hypothetical protein OS190_14650 [Sulfitobacter sp. F26204]|uniref:hypothetical protein n=1 Tax=Sulfitobacter sp. F26204 TaxID=2996014 RepID=UPI00225E52CC|nr:hypothetical protein [Sulfitobacter sp. F26204]MCX7560813.1 hypothetical protein [Sulfitobacter sp. F26204]
MADSLLCAKETDRFQLKDLFFSRTDKRGVICSANEVLRHVAFMDWDELIGAPHRVVRHPLMPRAVFKLIWQSIQSGTPIGAYIVNQAKDKQCYWVYAIVIPVEDGYLSIRLKPGTEWLARIKEIYAQLRAAEDKGETTLEQSEAALVAATREFGATDYQHFMIAALGEEMTLRARRLERPRIPRLVALRDIEGAVNAIARDAQIVAHLFERTRQIPHNMQLQARRMEGNNGPIGVISGNLTTIAQDVERQVLDLHKAAHMGTRPLREAQFTSGVAVLMAEVVQQFSFEETVNAQRRREDMRLLELISNQYKDQARTTATEATNRSKKLWRLCKSLRRAVMGLQMSRIMCTIEKSTLQNSTVGLDEVETQLMSSESELLEVISRIERTTADIVNAADSINKDGQQTEPRQICQS